MQADLAELKQLKEKAAAGAKTWPGVLLFVLAFVCAVLYGVWRSLWLIVPSALCLIAGVILILRIMTSRRETEAALSKRQQILKQYRAHSEQDIETHWEEYQQLLLAVTEAENRELESRELYGQARQDLQELEDEALTALDFSSGDSRAAQLGRELAAARQDAEQISAQIASLNGRLSVLGDPMVLGSELKHQQEAYDEIQNEYDALALAVETLRQADEELQSRFSPALGKLASEYMAQVTGGRYADVLIDRDFSARTRTQDDSVARESEYLSAGTLDLMYLAVRLAVCELAMPSGEPCPLIIDDALVNLDETRLDQAMQLLREIAKKRQVILFTCRKTE